MRRSILVGSLLLAVACARAADLVGLWAATRVFEPPAQGSLVVIERDGRLVADIGGFAVPVTVRGAQFTFELPGGKGAFRGRMRDNDIVGFWTQPPTVTGNVMYATSVTLRKDGASWRGEVEPYVDRFTFYLPVTRAEDGALATYLRNPERNAGIFTPVKSMVVDGEKVRLVGTRRGSDKVETFFDGRLQDDVITLRFPGRGGHYDFHKLQADGASSFYPRGHPAPKYRYSKPLQRDDGWPTASPEEAGISRAALEAYVQKIIDAPMTALGSGQIHSVLIARNGKLVLEEYFHGHHRDQPHDTRSAAKSLATVAIGAAMQAGIKVGPETPVYQTMLGSLPANLEPRKRAMTLENLLMMRGGHYCNDSDPNAPGNEDTMQEQTKERDWFRFILALPMDRAPGEKLIYCSIDAHLAGGVLAKAANEPWADLFDRLVARPLKFGRYHLFLAPTGEAYLGGGAQLLPRDFLKVAQLMLNDGVWEGRRILPREWVRKSAEPMADIMGGAQQYGYLWNSSEYPYRDRKVRAFFAAGNGGQIFMGIPDLGLAIAFTGGSYNDRVLFVPQRKMVPEDILPAVQ